MRSWPSTTPDERERPGPERTPRTTLRTVRGFVERARPCWHTHLQLEIEEAKQKKVNLQSAHVRDRYFRALFE
jgi:hypothetical protein